MQFSFAPVNFYAKSFLDTHDGRSDQTHRKETLSVLPGTWIRGRVFLRFRIIPYKDVLYPGNFMGHIYPFFCKLFPIIYVTALHLFVRVFTACPYSDGGKGCNPTKLSFSPLKNGSLHCSSAIFFVGSSYNVFASVILRASRGLASEGERSEPPHSSKACKMHRRRCSFY